VSSRLPPALSYLVQARIASNFDLVRFSFADGRPIEQAALAASPRIAVRRTASLPPMTGRSGIRETVRADTKRHGVLDAPLEAA
jgi:hypothetical protein